MQAAAPDGVQRQKGRTAGIAALKHLDGKTGVLLGIDHNVLAGIAEGRLNGEGGFPFGAQQAGDRPVDVPQGLAFVLAHDGTNRFGIALIVTLHIGQNADAGFEGAAILFQTAETVRLTGQHAFAAVQLHPAALSDVFGGCPFFQEVGFLFFDFLQALLAAGDFRFDFADTAALLFQVLENPSGVLNAAFNVGVQNGSLGLAGREAGLGGRETVAGLFALNVLLVHALAQAVA